MKKFGMLTCLCALIATFGCAEKGKSISTEKKISKATPQKVTAKSVAPTAAKTANSPADKAKPGTTLPTGHPPTAQKTKAGPSSRPTSRPTSKPTSRPSHAAGAKELVAPGIIKGRVDISEALRTRVKGGTTLFISVRRYEGEGKRGMIMAAKKLPIGGASLFPLDFTVTQRDIMMGGTKLSGPVTVSARIDQDGDAISKQPGDIEGAHKGSIVVGKGQASITLDVLRQ